MRASDQDTTASPHLVALARQIATAYVAEAGPRGILLTGSAAEGVSDFYSDLDVIAYYDQLPSDAQLRLARRRIEATDFRPRGARNDDFCVEEYLIGGVECEMLHTTVPAWERQMQLVLEEHQPAGLAQKAIGGLLDGLALHDDNLIRDWKLRAARYPDGLRRAMVEQYLRFFPIWYARDRLASRDAILWHAQVLVEATQNILGILAGLNRLYYSPFQFKRLRRFVSAMRLAPDNLPARLDGLFALDPTSAAAELERLVAETVTLVEAHLPDVDTSEVRRTLGARQRPWRLSDYQDGERPTCPE